MKKIILKFILLLLFLTPIQASNNRENVSSESFQSQVVARVQENYTLEIAKHLDFGLLSKQDPIKSQELIISLRDVIPNDHGKIQVKLLNSDLKMWDEEREHSLSLKTNQSSFDFDLKDQSQSLILSLNPKYITAAGNYQAVLDFEINYMNQSLESMEESPLEWFNYQCSKKDLCDIKGFSDNIVSLLDKDGIKEPIAIKLPQEVEGKKITGIYDNAFNNDKDQALVRIHSVHLPDTIINIGASSFFNQPLKEFKGGASVETIASNAFNGCELKHIRLKDKVKTINIYAFRNNPIEILELPLSIDKIFFNSFDENKDPSREIIVRYNGLGYQNNQINPTIASYTFKGYRLENNNFE